MNKTEWATALEALEKLLETAQNNYKLAKVQVEELEFNISNYKAKIETFK